MDAVSINGAPVIGTVAPGSRVGPYEVLSALGAGGAGQVYRARDTRLDRMVAIKVLAPSVSGDPDQLRRLQGEARAIAALNHPHICQIYDVGPAHLVLEYIDGAPAAGPMAPETAIPLALQIAGAVDAAHRRGILHRDLKPGNVMVTRDGVAKVLDFGLAKMIAVGSNETQTAAGIVMGTPAYMSPEQVEGRQLDVRTDVFSFGALLYEMLSGRRAFQGNSVVAVVTAVLRDDPLPVQTTPALERIVQRCLAKAREQRFQTMGEVRAALEQAGSETPETLRSIAVLPFANLSAERDNEYFSDGLTEETINALTRIPRLKVTARTSAFAFRGKEIDIRTIGEALGVRTVMEGSVRRAGNKIRVTAQLINAADGCHLWSERFDREIADVFQVQDEIAAAIAGALEVKLSTAPARRPTSNVDAYENYLKAQYFSQKWTTDAMALARIHFERAIALDVRFALAHSMLAHHFVMMADSNMLPAHTAMPLARASAQRALAIDPAQPEAHAVLAVVAGAYDYDWQESERHFTLATATDPVSPFVRTYYVHRCLLPIGRIAEGIEQVGRAVREDPLNVVSRTAFALCLRAAGRVAECNEQLEQVLQLDEQLWFPNFGLGLSAALEGRDEAARGFAEKAHALAPAVTMPIGLLAAVTARLGETARSTTLLESLLPGRRFGAPLGLALYHLLSGNIDESAGWIERAIDQRQPAVLFFLTVHAATLRQSARWPAVAQQLRLPAAATP